MSALTLFGRRVRALRATVAQLSRDDAQMLLAMLGVAFCVWIFVLMADAVADKRTETLDARLLQLFRHPHDVATPRGPAWLPGVMRDVTALGSAPVLTLFVLAVAGSLVVRRQHHALALLLVATAGGEALNLLLKAHFDRARPTLVPHLMPENSPSFPSGHAMESAVVYFTLAAMLARLVEPRRLKLYFLGLAALFSFLVGTSRVYLGVHYPSDVLAGWTAGLAWAVLSWTVASYLQRAGTVESAK
jgi:undecaprenyl-diphosphatase